MSTLEPARIWTDDETADGCLRQAAYHGGMARCLIRILQQHTGQRASFSEAAAVDVVAVMARSGFRWASHYLALSEGSEHGYQQALGGGRREQCSCGGKRFVDDECWQPAQPWDGKRAIGDGLIPCGACNLGGWDTPMSDSAQDGSR